MKTHWIEVGIGIAAILIAVTIFVSSAHGNRVPFKSVQEEADRPEFVRVQDKLYMTVPIPDSIFVCHEDSTGHFDRCFYPPSGSRLMLPVTNGEGD